jgi:DNA polymerase-3 subunit delta'
LLLLLSALPEALPETILSRCIAIQLAPDGHPKNKAEEKQLVKLLQQTVCEQSWNIQYAYRLAQEFQRLLRTIREEIKIETDEALKGEEARYRDSTDGAWLEEREQYYKALTESFYLQRRAGLIETLFAWWSDVLRSSNRVERRNLPNAGKETGELASRFTTAEILRRIQRLEELRDHLSRNIQEALAIEVAFLAIFSA